MLPRVEVIALGGTIASTQGVERPGVVPSLTAADLLAAVPAARSLAEIGTGNLSNVPSAEIDLPLILRLAAAIRAHQVDGVAGVVVTQGTDTIEETAFALNLLHAGGMPVVVTGAMRHPIQPGPDGPANLYAAVVSAADPAFQGQGVLVAFDDVIHSAAWVQKRDTASTNAFWSPAPLGWLAEGRPVLRGPAVRQPTVSVPEGAPVPFVPILRPGLDDPPRLVPAALAAGAAGIVADLAGGGHVAASWADALGDAAQKVPVVFASRTRGGRVLSRTYGQTGAEIDLLRRGLWGAGDLDALKARLTLVLLVMAGAASRFTEFTDLSWRPSAS
jgi:L-asparaginase